MMMMNEMGMGPGPTQGPVMDRTNDSVNIDHMSANDLAKRSPGRKVNDVLSNGTRNTGI